jgi:hypothetical protein
MMIERSLELLHMNVSYLIAFISIYGSKYCLVIVDEYSCFMLVTCSQML